MMQMLAASGHSLRVTASGVAGYGSGASPAGSVSTSPASPGTTVTGGSGSYTYSWSQTGTPATNGPYNISSASAQNPTWSKIVPSDDSNPGENWKVTVTDTVTGLTAETTIPVELYWTDTT